MSGSAWVYPAEEISGHIQAGYVAATGYALGMPTVAEWGFPSDYSCIPQIFNRYPFRDAPQESVDGAQCVVLEAEGGHKMWLDPAKGYAVRKREYFRDGVRAGLIECHDFERVPGTEPPVYLPQHVVWTNYGGEGNELPLVEDHFVLQRVEINRPERHPLMDVEVEPGTVVIDQTKRPIGPDGEPIADPGIAYPQPESPEQAAEIIRTAQESAGRNIAAKRGERLRFIAIVAVALLGVAAGGFLLYRRWQRA